MNERMKWSLVFMMLAALAVAAPKQAPKPSTRIADKPAETWCIGPITALDEKSGMLTITVKSQGQSVQTQTEGPRFLGSFVVASSSAASEEQRTFQCAPQCVFVTQQKPFGATLADFKVGETVHMTCAGTNAPWVALQVKQHLPPPAAPRR